MLVSYLIELRNLKGLNQGNKWNLERWDMDYNLP